ncbi:MAG: 2-phospho-L-lactate guanylyltransferase [Thermomicrobium sp.]|nr:2-phospho-L-lactate guanylyltransferase [Thermomicrobium sp.]MDW8059290.1 2-phospho-L-lactate guanylyltransferase [Thermomicrobium sp.]
MSRVLAAVPIQRLALAKSRMAPVLDAPARQRLVLALAERTVRILASVPAVSEVALVTPDPDVAALAASWGARPLAQPEPGLVRAVALAQQDAVSRSFRALVVVLGDLPLLESRAIDRALALLEPYGAVIAPDRHGTGTNLLALCPPDLPVPAFGPDSRRRHRAAARRARCTLREVWTLSLALDVDTPEDLALAQRLVRREGETWSSDNFQ